MSSKSGHLEALNAMLSIPSSFKNAKEAKTYLAAERAYAKGEFQTCLSLLQSLYDLPGSAEQ